MNKEYLNKVWKDNPEYIRRFYHNLNFNEKLCNEVKYILSTELKSNEVEIAQISARAKTLESFCEKISRKKYKSPFDDITDFAGVRIVYLYSAGRTLIETLIEEKFDIIEKVDKIDLDLDRFGYGALHYLVKLKNNHVGARYDELKDKTCEIQVRTILQDAWAVVAHHLSYKQESHVPIKLRRKLNALSGLFETADDQFENIKTLREAYLDEFQGTMVTNTAMSLHEIANLDNLKAYLNWKYPEREGGSREQLSDLLNDLNDYNYNSLDDIDKLINKSSKAVKAIESRYPPSNQNEGEVSYSSIGMVRTSLTFIEEDYRDFIFSSSYNDNINEFLHLIE
jgi:ppGpp synthetase/RelA/SpoT-type nucleotidyltranferase